MYLWQSPISTRMRKSLQMEKMISLSIRARVAYAILCLEHLLQHLKYDFSKWELILEELWQYTAGNPGQWHESMAEMIPFSINEEIAFELKECVYINLEKHDQLQELYKDVHEDVLRIIGLTIEIGTRDLYASIVNNSPDTLNYLDRIIAILERNGVELPTTAQLKSFTIDQQNGWGNPFARVQITEHRGN